MRLKEHKYPGGNRKQTQFQITVQCTFANASDFTCNTRFAASFPIINQKPFHFPIALAAVLCSTSHPLFQNSILIPNPAPGNPARLPFGTENAFTNSPVTCVCFSTHKSQCHPYFTSTHFIRNETRQTLFILESNYFKIAFPQLP